MSRYGPWIVVGLLAAGCSSGEESPAPEAAAPEAAAPEAAAPESPAAAARPGNLGLQPVPMPDVSNADASVQAQVRGLYEALQALVGDANAPDRALADAYGEMGKLFTATEYLDAAEASFGNARRLSPSDMRWPYYLAHVSRLRNDPVTAAVLFEETLALDPDYVPALEWLGAMYLETSRAEDAEAPFGKALSLEPESASALYGLGRVALDRREYAQAVERLERALELAPQASSIEYPLALAYRGLGNVAQAEAHLARRGDVQLRRTDPLLDELGSLLQNTAAFEVRGAEALTSGDWAAAIANLERASELTPDNPSTRLNLGSAYFLSGDAASAVEHLEAAARLAPEDARAHYALGLVMETAGPDGAGANDARAIDYFLEAVRRDPTAVEMRVSLADALRRSGRLEESLPHYAEALELDPATATAHFGHAMALVRLGRYGEARRWLESGVKTFPEQPGFPHALARLLAAAPDDRVRDGRRALLLLQPLMAGSQNVTLGETMAMTLAELGDFEEAVAWQQGAIATARQAGRTDLVAAFSENLALYEAGRPCRTPWRPDDPAFHPRPETE